MDTWQAAISSVETGSTDATGESPTAAGGKELALTCKDDQSQTVVMASWTCHCTICLALTRAPSHFSALCSSTHARDSLEDRTDCTAEGKSIERRPYCEHARTIS